MYLSYTLEEVKEIKKLSAIKSLCRNDSEEAEVCKLSELRKCGAVAILIWFTYRGPFQIKVAQRRAVRR